MKKPLRILQLVFVAIWALSTLALLPLVVRRWDVAGPQVLILPIMLFVLMALPAGMIEMQFRSLKRKGARVREAIDAIAPRVFDQPAPVQPGYDLSVTMPAGMASLVTAFDAGDGFTTSGVFRGVSVSVASHVSRVGRQLGELNHVYSHVVVDVLGATPTFALTRQGAGSFVGKMAGVTRDVKIGDEAFDARWMINSDEPLARAVLDDSIRARLTEMRSKVTLVSQDWGPGGMSVILTRHGLAIRWPGEMSPELAVYVRDLLIDMRTRMLAHLDRVARETQGAGAQYRVFADGSPGTPEEISAEARQRSTS